MEAAQNVSFSYKHRPLTPSESVVWWSEYVIKTNGAPLINSISSHLPWYIYWNIDIYCVILAVLLAVLYSWVHMYRKIFKPKSKPQAKVGIYEKKVK